MKKNFNKLFDAYEEKIKETEGVTQVEALMAELHKKIRALDSDLAEELDQTVGRIAWEYEKQGFCGGVMAAKSML